MNKITKIILYSLAFLIVPIILTGLVQFFVLIVLGISMGISSKMSALLCMYLFTLIVVGIINDIL